MKEKLDKLISRAFAKPLYCAAVILLGLPTMLASFLGFLVARGREEEEYKAFLAQARDAAEKDGTLAVIRENAKVYLTQKYRHFDRKPEGADFQRELEKQIRKDEDAEIAIRLEAMYAKEDKKGRRSFVQFLCKALDNKGLLALSVVTSLPMYILLLVFSNPYARYIFERLIMMVFVAFGVVFVVFTILEAVPIASAPSFVAQIADGCVEKS